MTRAMLASVAEGLARLERVRAALLRLLRAQQPEKGLALEIEDVLLRHGARRTVAAAEHIGELARDAHLVLGDLPAFTHGPTGVHEIAHRLLPERRDAARRGRHVIGR